MNFDLVKHGRYHYQQIKLRADIEAKQTACERESLCKEHVLANRTSIFKMNLALNLVTFFPFDPCHSEFSGLYKIAHTLLVDHILTVEGPRQYCQILQKFLFQGHGA